MAGDIPIRILIVDDHPLIRKALGNVISRVDDFKIVGEATNGENAVTLFHQLQPDIILMDLNMPVMSGIEAIRSIIASNSKAKIIVLTQSDVDSDVLAGFDAGACGYLVKDTPQNQLVNVIRKVNLGQSHLSNQLEKQIKHRKKLPELSPRELEVLGLIKHGKNNRAIGIALGITESTVKSHIKSILVKLGVNDRTQAITKALRHGIVSNK